MAERKMIASYNPDSAKELRNRSGRHISSTRLDEDRSPLAFDISGIVDNVATLLPALSVHDARMPANRVQVLQIATNLLVVHSIETPAGNGIDQGMKLWVTKVVRSYAVLLSIPKIA